MYANVSKIMDIIIQLQVIHCFISAINFYGKTISGRV